MGHKKGEGLLPLLMWENPPGVMQQVSPHDIQNSAFIFLWKTSGLNHKRLSCGVQSGPEVMLVGQGHESN